MGEESCSSMEFHDLDDSPAHSSASTSTEKKTKKFRSLSLKWRKSDESFDKNATLPQKKKKRKNIVRFLSFKKKSKEPNINEDVAASEFSFVASGAANLGTPVDVLHNTLQAPPVIELGKESKLATEHVPEDDSTDSFKSAGSPELRNRVEEPVDKQPDAETTALTERAFTVFADSEFVKDLVERGKSLQVDKMSQKRGRGTARNRQPDVEAETVAVPDPVPAPSSPEEPAKVSGDDLRKQLSEGLKNGAGKVKDVKAQLSEITQNAVKTSEEETQNFLDTVRSEETKSDEQKPSTSLTADPEQVGLPPTDNKKEHLYKILVIGELGTGKTSIIKRYVHQFFSQHYRATIGVDFALKVLNWDENSIIRLQLWDIAGQERFGNMTRVYYKEAVGAFIVFDVTRAATFDAVQKWKQDLDSKVQLSDGSPIPCVLLANKCDQPKEGLVNHKNKMDEYCKDNGFSGWFETSAKENINIEDAARSLVLKILQNDKLIRTGERGHDNDRIAVDGSSDASSSRGCSC